MRKLRIATWIILILLVSVWLVIQANQWLFRWRAEALLADIQALQLNHSSWSDAQRLMHRWGSWGAWYGSCNVDDCRYEIRMFNSRMNAPDLVEEEDRPPRSALIFDMLHIRFAGAYAGFHVVRGVVTNKNFGMEVALPSRLWVINRTYWPSLDAGFSEGAKLARSHDYFRAIHPNRDIGQIRIDLRVSFTPEESPEEQAALTDFRFDCLTRWSPCLLRRELLPRADDEFETQVQEEQKLPEAATTNNSDHRTCFPTVDVRAREESDVLLGEVIQIRNLPEDANKQRPDGWLADIRLREVLKGKAPVIADSVFTTWIYRRELPEAIGKAWSVSLPSSSHPYPVLVTGMSRTYPMSPLNEPDFASGDCGLVEASTANLAAARKGVQQDFGPRY